MENKYQEKFIQDDSIDNFQTDYKDTFIEENKQENLNYTNPNINTSDLTDNKNSTISKMKFYISMIVGSIVIILIIGSLLKNLLFSSDEKKEVKEIEAPKVETITKDDFFAKIKENTSEKISNIEKSNPFENIDTNNTNEVDIFSAVSVKPPKPQIVKGATGTIIGNNNNKSSGTASNNNKYDEQIKDLEAQREAIQNLENAGANSSSNKDFDGDTFSPTVAKMNEFNPDLLLPKGSYIGCSLDTRFVSAMSGSTSCTVSQNVYSSNGNVLLIEKGSKLFGTYKGDNANDGTSRYFVVWQEVRTPNHLRIPLNSGSSDELGGAGLEGEIDHKWMMRFGSSIMLSMVDDIFNVLAYKMTNKNGGSNSGNQIDYTENTRDNASNIASIALEKFINIKPTVYKQHGDLVGVYVNRDVDFSKVYKISRKK